MLMEMETTQDNLQTCCKENQGVSEATPEGDASGGMYKWRNLTAFWLLGLCNNFAYVIMLSAAHDILAEQERRQEGHDNITTTTTTTTMTPLTSTPQPGHSRECNKTSTGAILLADILPTLLIKLTAPWYLERLRYSIRVLVVVTFCAASFIIVSLSISVAMSLFGVVCASISSGFGEPTFLSLTAYYDKNTVSTWSSGTGAAGLFGALSYAGLTSAGFTPRVALQSMLIVPVALFVSYFFLLKTPPPADGSSDAGDHNYSDDAITDPLIGDDVVRGGRSSASTTPLAGSSGRGRVPPLPLRRKLQLSLPLLRFMLPLLVVYFAEYFINQGLTELMQFDLSWLTLPEQYRWYQVDYQLGVFISRSSVNIFPISRIWILAVLQCCNLVVFTLEAYYLFVPSIWIVLLLILWEGLLGGSGYVNTFYRLRNETPEEEREFSLTFASLADTTGVSIAGAVALPVHDYICALPTP